MLPVLWGDGGEKRFVVGTRRRTHGRNLIRLVMPSDRLVNFRVKPVYSPAVFEAMTRDWDPDFLSAADRERLSVALYEPKEDAEKVAAGHRWALTRGVHLLGQRWHPMHRGDEPCEFCDGRDAFWAGEDLDSTPHPRASEAELGHAAWWNSPHGTWAAGWRSEAQIAGHEPDVDLAIQIIGDRRAHARRCAGYLARAANGRTVQELESPDSSRDRGASIRFVRGDYEPRRLDGVVHAWVDDAEVVVRTQYA